MKVLLIDVGSSFVKYAVCEERGGEFLLRGKIPFPEPLCEEPFIVDRRKIEKTLRSVMTIGIENGCGRAFTAVQMHGFFLRNANGELSNYFSWRSGGGDVESQVLLNIDFSARGTKLKPNLPIAKLYKNREQYNGTEFFTLGSYIAYLFTGNNVTHKTDGCASGFYITGGKIDDKTIRGIILPALAEDVDACGEYCGMQIFAPVGDHASSVYGSGIDGDAYLLNVGTTSQIAYVGEGDAPSDMWEHRPYFEDGKTLFTLGNLLYKVHGDKEKYSTEAAKIITSLPPKKRILIGGGGADGILDRLEALLDTPCCLAGSGIGIDGLLRIAQKKCLRIGSMLSEVPFTNMPLIMKNCGLDFLIVDNEHGAFDYTTLTKLFTVSRLADFCAIVRLPDNTRAWITKCVDAGADGFLLPMTDTADDVRKVVEYAKYAPIGKRGISTMRAHTLYAPPPLSKYMSDANRCVKVYAQIETVAGVENVDSILAVNGVDGVFIGPNDLSCDMGCIGDNGPIIDAIVKIAAAAKKAGKPFGIITTSNELIESALKNGASMISYGSELNMLKKGCDEIRGRFR